MNKHLFLILYSLLGWTFALTAEAQSRPSMHFTRIGLKEGLSQSTVLDIDQDRMGNMWIATQNGLNKYNGYEFTVYRHDEADPTSIGNDYIYAIETDSRERVWIGTGEGLSCYDPHHDCFRNFPLETPGGHTPVGHIAELDSLHLLVASEGRLYTFHVSEGTFQAADFPGLPTGTIHSINRQTGVVYIGTDAGLYQYALKERTTSRLPCKEIAGKNILMALRQASSYLWIATEGDGLYRFDLRTHETRQYATGSSHYLGSDFVRSLALDGQGRLWVGTFTSLHIYDGLTDSFHSYTNDPADPTSLSQTSVRCIFKDKQDGMWLGTYFGGLNYYHPLRNRFQHLCLLPGRNSLNNNVISCITEGGDKRLWIGTNGGVNVYDPGKETFRFYTVRDGLGSNDIKAIYLDENGQSAYIGGHAGGLSVLHIPSGKIETILPPRFTTDEKSVYRIYPKGDKELWVGTLAGLKRFDKQRKTFLPCPRTLEDDQQTGILRSDIQFLFQDSRQRLWIGGKEGFGVFRQTPDGTLENLRFFPSDHLLSKQEALCVYEQGNGVYYIGTRNGLFCFQENSHQIEHYTMREGLPSNVVYGILKDGYGKLWMSTEQGLSCFTPETEAFRNFNADDGLQSTQFTPYAYARTTDGRMHFGGVNGLTSFYPEAMQNNPYVPAPVFTKLHLFNKEVHPGDTTGILQQHISQTHRLTLKSEQSMFSITFAVPNYVAGNHNTFAYKLEGYDKNWYETQSQRTVSYSNLPHGNYRFMVKAANNDDKWNDTPATLEIRILPIWYRTWWATLLFVVAAIGSVTFVIRYFWSQKMMKAQIEMERVDKERQKEVNEMKLRFFINISHELRTPLTLILAPLQDLLAKVNDRWTRKQLELIGLNTNRLLHLVNQLMDYRRAELGVFQLKVRRVPIHQTVKKNFQFYERIAQRKQIAYNFHSEIEGIDVLCDPEYVELIENNLLSNAFKYTGNGGSITVALKEADEQLILQVKDTGNGIPADKQERIFERFYQGDDEHLGSGIGLSLVQRLVELHHGHIELESREGIGSTFTIYLPCAEKAYKPEERADYYSSGAAMEEIHTTNRQEMYTVDIDGNPDEEKEADYGVKETTRKRRDENILVVEDNSEIRQYLADELGEKYSVWQAENGEKALELLKTREIDLILTDVMMPVMDGLQLCKHVKQNLNTCHIPVIILSAKADIKEQLEGLQVGADDYIPKPFVINVVVTKIRNLFRTRHRAIEYYSKSMDIEPEKIALNPMDEKLLKQAMEIMEKHMDNPEFTTDEFAREMCMSRSNLHLKMKALTGESTNEFIRKMRFNKACKLLKEGTYTVAEVSAMVGFSTPSYFTTSFKKYFGCLPSEYGK